MSGDTTTLDWTCTPRGLRLRRLALGLSQKELADALEVKQPTIARWEAGDRECPEGVWAQLEALEYAAGQRAMTVGALAEPESDADALAWLHQRNLHLGQVFEAEQQWISFSSTDETTSITLNPGGSLGPGQHFAHISSPEGPCTTVCLVPADDPEPGKTAVRLGEIETPEPEGWEDGGFEIKMEVPCLIRTSIAARHTEIMVSVPAGWCLAMYDEKQRRTISTHTAYLDECAEARAHLEECGE